MKRSSFNYQLPDDLVAYYPTPSRTASRLLCLNAQPSSLDKHIQHKIFSDILDLVDDKDLLIVNNTRVMPARLFAKKSTGGKLELLVEKIISDTRVLVHIKSSKSPKIGSAIEFTLPDGLVYADVMARHDALFEIELRSTMSIYSLMNTIGHIPLPPYIKRQDEQHDSERYQTVYAHELGAVAAPTAGLHFNDELLAAIKNKGVDLAEVTLHVGAGTFQPVRVDDIMQHTMHSEFVQVSETVCRKIQQTHARGGRVIAVGTTVVRCLETASQTGEIQPYCGETDIFIYPGYRFQCVDALITNFHLPESTLLMLVSAFAGYDAVMKAYQVAINEQYRFYSYGDAMFILPPTMSQHAAECASSTESTL